MPNGFGIKISIREIKIMRMFGRKKEKASCCCGKCCGESTQSSAQVKNKEEGIKILGAGCSKCNALEAAVREAIKELGMDIEVDHVTDFSQIAAYGVMTTPALIINGKAVSLGRVLKADEVKSLILKEHNNG